MDTGESHGNAKRVNFRGETSAEESVDRLGSLPAELVTHIMSFLPMEDAVRTDSLTTKWRYKWTEMTHIQVYDYYLYSRKTSKNELFVIFFEKVLILLGNQEIKSFSLECIKQYDATRVHTWITALIRRQVEKLKISCSMPMKGSLVFPISAFDFESLKEIHMLLICTFKVQKLFHFSSLKILTLFKITFHNMDYPSSKQICISFPLLQELSFWSCNWEKVNQFTIEAPVLECFSFGDCEHYNGPKHSRFFDCKLRIVGSMLQKFYCGDHSFAYISLENGLAVTDATIKLASIRLNRQNHMALLTYTLLRNLPNLKSLTLRQHTIEALFRLPSVGARFPEVGSIQHLTITGGTPRVCEAFIILLRHLPILRSLTIAEGYATKNDPPDEFNMECPLPHLKFVRILSLYEMSHNLTLAKFILKNAESLEELTITTRDSPRERKRINKEAKEELSNFPRASAHALVIFKEIA